MRRRLAQHGRTITGWVTGLAVVTLMVGPAIGAEGDEKEEQKVDVAEADNQKQRPTLENKEGGKDFKAEEFISEKNFASVKKQDEAIYRLKKLLKSTPKGDSKRADVLFNLSEMYWDKSKYYENEAFRKQDQCYGFKEAGKKEKHKSCKRRMQDMLDESKRLRGEAAKLYKKIIRNHPNFDKLDQVLFYLATNLQEADRGDEAVKVYRKLLSNFPDTKYKPNVLLSLGEYFFNKKEDPERALQFYEKVKNFPESSVYSYAVYKAGWCYYNMQEKDKALDVFIGVIDYAKSHPDQPNAQALVDQTRKDIVLTYSEVGTPEKAMPFFRDLADSRKETLSMAERLAIQYGDKGKYGDSTKMYRKLIQVRREKDEKGNKILDYQYEIVRNFTSQDPYNKKSIEELVKLMRLVQLAEADKHDHIDDSKKLAEIDKKKLKSQKDRIEQLVRQWSTRFHREAQVTKNDSLYKMAFFLYDNFIDTFPGSKHLYVMTFYNAEVLYHLEQWKKAAKMYDKVVAMKPEEGKHLKDAAHAAVLAYFELVNTSEKRADLESPLKFKEAEDRAENAEEEAEGEGESDEKGSEKREKKTISDIQKDLLEACKRYRKYVPDGDKIVDVKYTMARVYYEHNQLKKAIELFKDIAFNHPEHRLAVISANLHLDSINLLDNFDMLHEAVSQYMEKRPFEDEEFFSSVERLNRAIRFKLCREKEDAEKWQPAAKCYVKYSRDFPDSKYLDKALYNAALAFERIKELGKAIQVRITLLSERPNSDLAPETLFNIGGNYHALAVYSRAAKFYEKFAENFPDKQKMAEEALANASTFRRGLGHYDKAIADYNKYLELFGDSDKHAKKVANAAYQIAKIYEDKDQPDKALDQYREYLEDYADLGSQDRRLQAHVQIALYYWNNGDREQALEDFRDTLEVYKELPDETKKKLTEGRDAAAQAKFMLGEDIFEDVEAIEVESSNEEELVKKIQEQSKIAQKAKKIYEEVIKFKRPDWAIAALFKVGALYEEFAKTIRDSPVPDRLTYRQAELYRGAKEDKATKFENIAVGAYKRALDVATEKSWFNEYSKRAETRLADLRPGKFQTPAERRATPDNINDGYSRAGFIRKLEEDFRQLNEQLGSDSGSGSGGGGGGVDKKGPAADASSSEGKPSS